MIRKYQVQLTGVTPLLMHSDDVDWRDRLEEWRKVPANKKLSKAGDDRTPAFTWVGFCYHDGEVLGIPSDNLMTCIRDGASQVVANGKKTFKSQSQSGILVDEILWPVLINGQNVPWGPIENLMDEMSYAVHRQTAKDLGFSLFAKPAKIGQNKHIRVRPRFDIWSASGTISVFDDTITAEVLDNIFYMAGSLCGICDWRPKSPKSPGQFGRFTAEVKEIK
jgi:hypothetical protein